MNLNGAVKVYDDANTLAAATAADFMTAARRAIAERGAFYVALSGGSTPQKLYERLAADYVGAPEWSRIHLYFGDERAVPPEHEQSNFRMAKTALFDHVAIPAAHISRLPADSPDIQAAARSYCEQLVRVPQREGKPCFDWVLLGMGDDGHTASLFPGTSAVAERDAWVVPVYVERLKSWRLSVTFPVINNAHDVVLLVCGAGKATMLRKILREPLSGEPLPVQRVAPTHGALQWRLDRAAAAML